MLKRWQRIRRIGEGRFIASFILGFWLLMVPGFFLAARNVDPSLKVLHRLPAGSFPRLLIFVLLLSLVLYFGLRFAWRRNERKYSEDDRT